MPLRYLESELFDLRVGYAHTDSVGILPGEEMERAICTISVINRDCIPSGNTLTRTRSNKVRFCAEPVREFAPPYKASDRVAKRQNGSEWC